MDDAICPSISIRFGIRIMALLRLHDDLYYQAYRYRRTMMSRLGERADFLGPHTELADVV